MATVEPVEMREHAGKDKNWYYCSFTLLDHKNDTVDSINGVSLSVHVMCLIRPIDNSADSACFELLLS